MKYLYMNKYWEVAKDYNIDKLLYLVIDRPNEINIFNFVWKSDKVHREYDLPAEIWSLNEKYNLYWNKNNEKHREITKPAVVYHNGYKEYWINDNFIKSEYSK